MECILCEAGLVKHVIRRMSLAGATQFVASCRIAAQGARTFKAAISFACTRPGAYASNDFDVEMWEQMWESCAQSVAARGLAPSVWAYSERFIIWGSSGWGDEDLEPDDWELRSDQLDCFDFLSELLELAGSNRHNTLSIGDVDLANPRAVELVHRPLDMVNADMSTDIEEIASVKISAILTVYAYEEYEIQPGRLEDHGHALVALSNGRLAFMFWEAMEFGGRDIEAGAAVYMEKDLPTLFDLIRSTSGEDCHWTLGDGGTLTLACAVGLQKECMDYWYAFPLPHWQAAPMPGWIANDDQRDRLEKVLRTGGCQRTRASPQTRPESTTEPVIQAVDHADPPALRDESLLALQADSQWAEDVELMEHHMERAAAAASRGGVQPLRLSGKVYLLSFRSGKGELFRKMLLQDKEFKSLREGLRDARCPLELQPSGAVVLVRPDQYLEVVNCPALRARTLKRYNVIISESEEYLMNKVLLRMASRQRPRENRGEREELDLYGFVANFEIKRTFICEAPKLLAASSVVQSTTEAVRSSAGSTSYFAHPRSRNPRRYVQGAWGG